MLELSKLVENRASLKLNNFNVSVIPGENDTNPNENKEIQKIDCEKGQENKQLNQEVESKAGITLNV